ncbi:MAG: hypothetical protein ACYCWE_20745 [Eubacteriales bacterium]
MANYTKLTDLWVSGLLKVTGAITALGGIVGNLTGNVTGNVSGYALKSAAVVPTATGTTTGTIPAGVTHSVVTSADANHIVILPAPVPGLKITLINGATGYELRSSAPATIGINGGAAANAESAIGANNIVKMECVSATNWIGSTVTASGVVGVVQVAAP